MKKLILVSLMLSISLWHFACSPAPKPISVNVSCDEFYESRHITREVEVSAGAGFKVILCSNPTTGFQWEEARISDRTVLVEQFHEFVSPESKPPPPPGTPGQEVWTFKALKAGESIISVDYSRSWEGGEKGEWTFVLNVLVK